MKKRMMKAAMKYLKLMDYEDISQFNDDWITAYNDDGDLTFVYISEEFNTKFPRDEFHEVMKDYFKDNDQVNVRIVGDVIGFSVIGEDRAIVQHAKGASREY